MLNAPFVSLGLSLWLFSLILAIENWHQYHWLAFALIIIGWLMIRIKMKWLYKNYPTIKKNIENENNST